DDRRQTVAEFKSAHVDDRRAIAVAVRDSRIAVQVGGGQMRNGVCTNINRRRTQFQSETTGGVINEQRIERNASSDTALNAASRAVRNPLQIENVIGDKNGLRQRIGAVERYRILFGRNDVVGDQRVVDERLKK